MPYTLADFRRDLNAPYVWPGGYPRYFTTHDGAVLSFEAARENAASIRAAIRENDSNGWLVVACDVNWEDATLTCDHTGRSIESAYGEPA